MAKLIIKRKYSVKLLFREPFKIFIDGKLMGKISPAQELEFELNEGKHLLVLESSVRSVEKEVIIEKDTKSVEITTAAIRIYLTSIPVIRDIVIK